MNKKLITSFVVLALSIFALFILAQSQLSNNLGTAIKVVNILETDDHLTEDPNKNIRYTDLENKLNLRNKENPRKANIKTEHAEINELPKQSHLNHGVISKTTLNCSESNIQEAQNISQAFRDNNILLTQASNHLIYHINSCSSIQTTEILKLLITETSDNISAMDLIIDLYNNADRKLNIIRAIQNAQFNNEQLPLLIDHIQEAPLSIKAALIPDILRKDDLNSFKTITSYEYMYKNTLSRSGERYTEQQAIDKTIQLIMYSTPNNLIYNGDIYGYLLDTYQDQNTTKSYLKLLINSSFNTSEQGETI